MLLIFPTLLNKVEVALLSSIHFFLPLIKILIPFLLFSFPSNGFTVVEH